MVKHWLVYFFPLEERYRYSKTALELLKTSWFCPDVRKLGLSVMTLFTFDVKMINEDVVAVKAIYIYAAALINHKN